MLLHDFLADSAQRNPHKVALICGAERLRYRDIDDLAGRLAGALAAEGLERGDRAVVFLENSVEAVVSIFAILRCGGVFLVVNPTTKLDKLAYILNNCRAKVLVSDSGRAGLLAELCPLVPTLRSVFLAGSVPAAPRERATRWVPLAEALDGPSLNSPEPRGIDLDLASIIYTSGSTGNPKGVTLTHLNMVSAATSITTYLENVSDDVILNVLPLSFDYGLYQLLMAFKIGGTLVLERSFTFPYPIVETMLRERVTGFPGVPTLFGVLLQMEELKKLDFDALRYVTNTAAALPPHFIRGLQELFPRARIYSMYGLTECKRVAYLPPEELARRPTSVGKAMPNVEAYLVDEKGRRLPPGETGELVIRGSNVMRGYWEAPEETERVLRPGPLPGEKVLYSGDLFRTDEEGFLYFVARKDDIIKSRGEKVSPKEVENVLYELDGVLEAAVIGVPDEILGQAVKALVVAREGAVLTEKDVQRHCARHLEDFMVPKRVEFVASLPKTATGKIRRKDLG